MAISRKDCLTLLLFATHQAKIDFSFDKEEKTLLMRLAKEMKATPKELELLKGNASLKDSFKNLKSKDSKIVLVNLLILVAGFDGVFDTNENAFISRVIESAGLDYREFPVFETGKSPDHKQIEEEVFKLFKNATD